jgi:hypothetical protein
LLLEVVMLRVAHVQLVKQLPSAVQVAATYVLPENMQETTSIVWTA